MKYTAKTFKRYGQLLELGRKQTLQLAQARGERVRCLRGTLWITQEGDREDHIVSAGEDFTVNRDGVTLVTVIQSPSTLMVTRPAPQDYGVLERWLERSALAGRQRQGDYYGTR